MTRSAHGRTDHRWWSNWAGNQRAVATAIAAPGSADDVADAVRSARGRPAPVKVVGSGHSFTAIALADDRRMDLSDLADLVSVDAGRRLVTVRPG